VLFEVCSYTRICGLEGARIACCKESFRKLALHA
jgi:hypothetical protein